jgi:hypothetical protein
MIELSIAETSAVAGGTWYGSGFEGFDDFGADGFDFGLGYSDLELRGRRSSPPKPPKKEEPPKDPPSGGQPPSGGGTTTTNTNTCNGAVTSRTATISFGIGSVSYTESICTPAK